MGIDVREPRKLKNVTPPKGYGMKRPLGSISRLKGRRLLQFTMPLEPIEVDCEEGAGEDLWVG